MPPQIPNEGVLEALLTNLASRTDSLGLTCGTTLLREEGLRVRLGAQSALLPRQRTFIDVVTATEEERQYLRVRLLWVLQWAVAEDVPHAGLPSIRASCQ